MGQFFRRCQDSWLCWAIIFSVWLRVGRDPAKGTIIPLFEPPKGFSPAAVRFLMRMGFDAKTFAAAVLDMAVKGYLPSKRPTVLLSWKKKAPAPSRQRSRV